MTAPVDLPEPVLPPELSGSAASPDVGRRRWGRWATLMVAVVVLAGVLVLTHPFTSSRRTTPLERLTAAESAVSTEPAFTFTLHGSELLTDGSSFQVVNDPVTISGSGTLNKTGHSAEMTYEVKVATISIKIREVLSGGFEYINFPSLTPYLPSGKTWIKVPASALGSKSSLSDFSSSPVFLKLLRAKEVTVVDAGATRVAGVPVENYRVTLDQKAVAEVGSPVAESGATIKPGSLVFEIAIGSQNTIRQIAETVVESKASTNVRVQLNFVITHYGLPVGVSVPPARLVDSLSSTQFKLLEKLAQATPPKLV
jgi:hypothetical protein